MQVPWGVSPGWSRRATSCVPAIAGHGQGIVSHQWASTRDHHRQSRSTLKDCLELVCAPVAFSLKVALVLFFCPCFFFSDSVIKQARQRHFSSGLPSRSSTWYDADCKPSTR